MPVKLTYWDVRGLGEPIRHLLRYQNEPWENDILVPNAEGFRHYMTMRDAADMPFGNLPFIEDNGVKITQSITVMRYLGRKYNLFPTNPQDVILCETVEQEVYDLRNRLTNACYNRYTGMGPIPGSEKGVFDHEHLKKALFRRLKERLPKFEGLLSKSIFVVGDKPVYVDFILYEYLDQLRLFLPAAFDGFESVNSYLSRIRELPGLKDWFTSEEYMKGEYVNAPHAAWNGKD